MCVYNMRVVSVDLIMQKLKKQSDIQTIGRTYKTSSYYHVFDLNTIPCIFFSVFLLFFLRLKGLYTSFLGCTKIFDWKQVILSNGNEKTNELLLPLWTHVREREKFMGNPG